MERSMPAGHSGYHKSGGQPGVLSIMLNGLLSSHSDPAHSWSAQRHIMDARPMSLLRSINKKPNNRANGAEIPTSCEVDPGREWALALSAEHDE